MFHNETPMKILKMALQEILWKNVINTSQWCEFQLEKIDKL